MNFWDTKSPNNRRRPNVFLRNSSSVCHWVGTVDTIPLGIDGSSVRFFITIILRSMGWSVQQSLLLVGFLWDFEYVILNLISMLGPERTPICLCSASFFGTHALFLIDSRMISRL